MPDLDHRTLTLSQIRHRHFLWTACEHCQDGRRLDLGELPADLDVLTVREIHFGCHLHCPTCGLPVASTMIYADELGWHRAIGGFSGWTRWRVVHSGGARMIDSPPKGV